MGIFDVYMARYCVSRQHQFSGLSTLRKSSPMLYDQVQAKSRVLELEKELEKVRLEWLTLVKERVA